MPRTPGIVRSSRTRSTSPPRSISPEDLVERAGLGDVGIRPATPRSLPAGRHGTADDRRRSPDDGIAASLNGTIQVDHARAATATQLMLPPFCGRRPPAADARSQSVCAIRRERSGSRRRAFAKSLADALGGRIRNRTGTRLTNANTGLKAPAGADDGKSIGFSRRRDMPSNCTFSSTVNDLLKTSPSILAASISLTLPRMVPLNAPVMATSCPVTLPSTCARRR